MEVFPSILNPQRPGYNAFHFKPPYWQEFVLVLYFVIKYWYVFKRNSKMSASRFLLRTGLLTKFARRAFATEVAVSPTPRLEHYSPVEMERAAIAEALAEKAKKPWTELSKDDKIASKFKST